MYSMCGPRQLFFQCGPEMPKGRTPLKSTHIYSIESPVCVSSTVSLKISFPSHDHCLQLCLTTPHFTLEPLQLLFKCARPFSVQSLLPTAARPLFRKCCPHHTSPCVNFTVSGYAINICALPPISHVQILPHPKCEAVRKWSPGEVIRIRWRQEGAALIQDSRPCKSGERACFFSLLSAMRRYNGKVEKEGLHQNRPTLAP